MNVKDLLGKAEALFKEAGEIVSNPDATPEDRAKVTPMLEDARRYKADALQMMEIMKEAAQLPELAKGQTGGSHQNAGDPPGQFKSWGEFLQAVHLAKKIGRKDERLTYFEDEKVSGFSAETKDMSGETGAGGGFLIAPEFRNQLLSVMGESALVRPYATVIPMARRQISIPALDQTQSLDAGVPRWFGGFQFYWIGEGDAKPTSDAKFREVTLTAKKLVGFTRASDELVADAGISFAAFINSPVGLAGGIAWMEDYAFHWGTGVAQPLGVMNSPALLSVKRDVSGKVTYDDLVRMMAAAMPSANLRWEFSQTTLTDLMLMQDSEGHLIWASATQGAPGQLLGLPYRITEKMAAHGSTGDAGLFDWGFYLIGDRQATTIESTQYEAWLYDKTSWRAVHRVDGQPWLNAPLTFQDGTTQVSPFVALSSDVS